MEQRRRTRSGLVAASVATAVSLLATTVTASGPALASRDTAPSDGARRVSATQAADPSTWRPAGRADHRAAGRVFGGLRETPRCAGGFEVEDSSGACSHGPDPAPAGIDVRDTPTVAELRAEASAANGTAAATGAVPCYGDGISGKRVQAIYAVSSDLTDRYASVVDLIRGYAWNADQAFYNSAVRDGGIRHLRWVTNSSCQLVVDHVVLSPTGDDSIANTRTELRNLGYTSNDRKYIVFADAAVYCGISYTAGDARPDATNPANSGATVSRIDSACWGGTTSVPAHEISHGLGAVQLTAPHSNGAWHCTDEYDRLCYDDGSGATMTYLCATSQEPLLDCNGDDYFNVAPAADSWLATHWNLASSAFLESTEPVPPTPAPTSTPTVTATSTPTVTATSTPTVTATSTPTVTATSTPTVTATSAPTVTVISAPTVTAAPIPIPTVSPSASPSPVPRQRRKPRVRSAYSGALTATERNDSFRFRAGSGRLTAKATVLRGSGLKVRVTDSRGQVLLRRTGRTALSGLVTVPAGRYRLTVTGPAGTRYRVVVERTRG